MSTLTRPAAALVPPSARGLPPRAPALRPAPAAPPSRRSVQSLAAWRATINRAALARSSGENLSVVLCALARPGGDLAVAQSFAEAERLLVVDHIVDTLGGHDQACEDDPTLRRGYARVCISWAPRPPPNAASSPSAEPG
ncbi:hypothetical protein [Streptomyces flaveolus]|uniref:hypothetical protein n=1 Tax=Streptomyces flaveolus TaxID=67297 RepID=UPI0036FFB27F